MENITTIINVNQTSLDRFSEWYRGIHGYASFTVCFFGVIMNFFNIIVLTRKHMLTSTNTILTALAISDFVTMIVYMPTSLKLYCILEQISGDSTSCQSGGTGFTFYWAAYALFFLNMTVTMHSISIWLTVLLAFFRYMYICHNKIGKKLCTRRNTITAIIITYISCIILSIPAYMVSAIAEMNLSNSDNETHKTVKMYNLVQAQIDKDTNGLIFRITFISQAFCIKLIPCLLLIVLSSLLIHSIQVANRNNRRLQALGRRARENEKSKEHARTNIMLVLVCVLFFITEFPQGILSILSFAMEQSKFYENVYVKLGDLMDILALTNNAINFVLYCLMSNIFRQTFQSIFCKAICKNYKKFNSSLKNYNYSAYNYQTDATASFRLRSLKTRRNESYKAANGHNIAVAIEAANNTDHNNNNKRSSNDIVDKKLVRIDDNERNLESDVSPNKNKISINQLLSYERYKSTLLNKNNHFNESLAQQLTPLN